MALIGTRRALAAARSWWTAPPFLLDGVAAALLADLGRDRYALAGRSALFSDLFALTSGAKWAVGPDGAWTQVAAGSPAFDWSFGRRRLLLEGASTNMIRNSAAAGAVAGTPGTAPTNWSAGSLAGTTRSVVGSGATSGIAWVDIRYAGTTTATSASVIELDTNLAAAPGQVWTLSDFLAIPAGSLAGIQALYLSLNCLQSDGVTSVTVLNSPALAPTAALARLAATFTLPTNTAFIRPRLRLTYASGATIDVTLRIGRPQLEQAPAATSPILTTGSATVTRPTDQLVLRPAAAALVAVSTGTLALAGRILPSGPSGTQQGIFSFGNGAFVRVAADNARLAYDLGGSGIVFDAAPGFGVGSGAEIGAAVRWDDAGDRRGGSNLGRAIVASTAAIGGVYGTCGYGDPAGAGLAAGAVHWHDLLGSWPAFPTDPGVQGQARAWS